MGYIPDPDNPGKTIAEGITFTQKQKDAMAWPLENATGSLTFRDDNSIKDSSGDKRFEFTDAGSLILRDDDGVAGITLDASTNTTIAGNLEVQGSIGFYDTAPVAQAAAIADLTDNSGGTSGGDTIADITDVTTTGCADRVPTENAIATLAAKIDAITLVLRNLGLIA